MSDPGKRRGRTFVQPRSAETVGVAGRRLFVPAVQKLDRLPFSFLPAGPTHEAIFADETVRNMVNVGAL
jgi:hypothetical protein